MSSHTFQQQDSLSPDEIEVHALYRQMLDGWNQRSAKDMASFFAENGNLVRFDGSEINGRAEIESQLRQIFADQETAPYVAKVRGVRFLTAEVALLRGIAGMVPSGQSDLNPAVNAVQTLVAARRDGTWGIELFQNTPAQFHGRPELVQQMTEELRRLLE